MPHLKNNHLTDEEINSIVAEATECLLAQLAILTREGGKTC